MKLISTILIPLILTYCSSYPYNPNVNIPQLKVLKTTAERIRENGYPAESHYVETSDGYVLNLFRIPYSPKLRNEHDNKPIVLIQHGLLSSSDGFLLNGPDNAMPYNFADNGFDVWLGNARGNLYSTNNTKMSLNHPRFWQFSWHEIGVLDIPAMIDYILEQTSQASLHYVGHSQGTVVFVVMASSRPEYNAKIKTAHMLAPAVFMGNSTNMIIRGLATQFGVPGRKADLFANQQFFPRNHYSQRILDTICGGNPAYPNYCDILFQMMSGPNNPNLNMTILPLIAESHPAGISSNQGIHYLQLHVSNEFRQYDHGVKMNLKYYNDTSPPNYDLKQVTADMYIYYSLGDSAVDAKDAQRLAQQLNDVKLLHEVPDPTWGHMDYIFGLKVKELVNDLLIKQCTDYESTIKY